MAEFKILLVDDEKDFLKIMGERIKSWGYEVIEASTGAEGMEAFRAKRPDVVILDYMMPGMDGITTLKEIRKLDKKVAVIMFTAHPEAKAMEGARKLNVGAFIPKLSAYTDTQNLLRAAIQMIEKKSGRKGSRQ